MKLSALFIAAMLSLATAGTASAFPMQGPHGGFHPMQGLQKPRLGVGVSPASFEVLESLGIGYGVRVGEVYPEGPAAKAGIQGGDIITELDGQAVYSPRRLIWLVSRLGEADSASLKILRDGQPQIVALALEQPQSTTGPMATHAGPAFLGIRMEPAADGKGVRVVEVIEGSPAASAGLAEGDLITAIGGKRVDDPRNILRAMRFFDAGDTIDLSYSRAGATTDTQVTLGTPPEGMARQMRMMPRLPPMGGMPPRGFFQGMPRHRDCPQRQGLPGGGGKPPQDI